MWLSDGLTSTSCGNGSGMGHGLSRGRMEAYPTPPTKEHLTEGGGVGSSWMG